MSERLAEGSLVDVLCACVEYPTAQTGAAALELAQAAGDSSVGRAAAELAAWLRQVPVAAAEERYTQLFDLKPVVTLNLTHHLFGDTYDRGALLAGLAGELGARGIPHAHDLPDHLPTILRLLAALEEEEDRILLAHAVVVPALRKVADKLAQSEGPWPALLRALPDFIATRIPRGETEVPELPERPLEVLQCST
jgi:nitrate reductase delta subunit